jgi:GT2 family glycosyltransferase
VIIDNGSTDESLNFLEEWFPEIKIIALNKNYGFAEGYNRGLQSIESPYLLILNSDVKLTSECVTSLVSEMIKNPEVAIIQPKIRSIEDPKMYEYAGAAGGKMDKLGYPYCRGRIFHVIEKDEDQYPGDYIDWASGACMLIKNEIFKNLGGFDGSYFAHQEEIDLSWRINKSGYKILCTEKAIAYHLGGGTLEYGNHRKVFLNFRNNLSTIIKNEQINNLFWVFPIRLVLDGVAGIQFLLKGHFKSCLAIIRAHLYIYSNIPTLMAKRKYYNKLITAYKLPGSQYEPGKLFSILYRFYFLGQKKYSQLK